jgi:hypothetical protein
LRLDVRARYRGVASRHETGSVLERGPGLAIRRNSTVSRNENT